MSGSRYLSPVGNLIHAVIAADPGCLGFGRGSGFAQRFSTGLAPQGPRDRYGDRRTGRIRIRKESDQTLLSIMSSSSPPSIP
jgi:hypothetical protein